MKALVTGATGFVGRFLCERLQAEGHDVVRLSSRNCDLTDQAALHTFNDARYDRIYHLAAWTQAGEFCLHHPGEQWVINQQINTNTLAWWSQHQPQAKLIALGSSCAYDPDCELSEDNYLRGVPIQSLLSYAMTKRMLYVGLLSLSRQFGLRYLYLVPSTLYGPGYHTDGRQMHFIFDLIRKIMRGKVHGEPVVLWGDGYQRRELVYIDDFVEVLLRLDAICENDTVNIGAGEDHTIREFAALICDELGYDAEAIAYDATRYVGAQAKLLAVDKLRRLLPEFTPTPVEKGLRETIEWFRAHPELYG